MNEVEEAKSKLAHLDQRIHPSSDMGEPNQDINIFSGEFQLRLKEKSISVNGKIWFSWFPSTGVNVSGMVTSGTIHALPLDEAVEIVVDGLQVGECHISNKLFGAGELIEGHAHGQVIIGDKSVATNKVEFSIPNLREYFGQPIKDFSETQIITDKARLNFRNEEYDIVIDKARNFKDLSKSLETKGGYIILYGGEISKKKGVINYRELKDLQHSFNHFLYFLNGRRTALYFIAGKHDGEEKWRDYCGFFVDQYKYVNSWSRLTHTDGFEELWQNFSKLWKERNNKEFLELLIHWYVEANNQSAYAEGAIIFAQTALELIYNWLIIEKKKMIIGDEAANLSAANKIRLILSQLHISAEVPPFLAELLKLDDINDGPEALVSVRNALVHGQEKKRAKAMALSPLVKFQALQLGIWYVELSILYILEFNGRYFNRVGGNLWLNEGETLPWLKQQ